MRFCITDVSRLFLIAVLGKDVLREAEELVCNFLNS